MWYKDSEILFGNKNNWDSDADYNMDETWKHDAKWNKLFMKYHLLYNSTYIKYTASMKL